MLNNIQSFIEGKISPVMQKLAQNGVIRAMSTAMMRAMPVMLGGALFSLLANFPISQVTEFIASIGLLDPINRLVTTTTNLNPILFIAMYCYSYAKNAKVDAIPCMLFGIVIFFVLMPSTLQVGDEVLNVYSAVYMAGNGIFVALIAGMIISFLYVFLVKKNLTFKMPDSVPPMVSESFSPIFIGIIIFGLFLMVDFGIQQTSYGNLFTFIQTVVQKPIVAIGANVPFLIFYYTIINLTWFFGIHPSALLSLFTPVITLMFSGNISAFMQGLPCPYEAEYFAYMVSGIGGTGNILGLAIIMLFFSKSKRYKAVSKIASVPAVFNINEPVMFGAPIIMNSAFFIPMILSPLVNMGAMYILSSFVSINFNPLTGMSVPWSMPWPITAFLAGGLPLFIIMMIIIGLDFLLFYPFFKIADNKALLEEQETA